MNERAASLIRILRGHLHHPNKQTSCYRCEAADYIEELDSKCQRLCKSNERFEHEAIADHRRIEELEAQLGAVRDCQTYVVELDDCEIAWFKKDDVLKAIGEDDE